MEQLAWEIGETSHALRRAFDRRAASLGVTRPQWRVLAHLGRAPGQRQVELAERMDIEPITLCRIVDRLEEAGLVDRRRHPGDRRAWQLFNTAKAEPLLERLHALAHEMGGEAFAGCSSEEIETARELLARVRGNLANAQKSEGKGCTTAQLALAWVLSRGDDIVPIPGTKRRRYLDENIAATELSLSDDELSRLEEILPPGAAAGDRYHAQGMATVNR